MSTTSNASGMERTSDEAAASPGLPGRVPGEWTELEGSGELSNPAFIPPTTESAHRRGRSYPTHDASEVNLGVKWGLEEYGRVMETTAGGRVTRRVVRAARGIEPEQPTPVRTYRGHRGTRTTVSVPLADPKAVPEGGSEGRAERRKGSLPEDQDERRDGSYLEAERREGSLDSSTEERRNGSLAESYKDTLLERLESAQQSASDGTSEGDSEDEVAIVLGTEQWMPVRTGSRAIMDVHPSIKIASKFFPNWFDLCDAEDQLGPLPGDWLSTRAGDTPTLPDVSHLTIGSSLLDEFWHAVSTQNDGNEVESIQKAIRASMITADAERQARLQKETSLRFHAVIVEIEDEDTPAPAGTNGRFTANQKQKSVPRSSEQREFLENFAGGRTSRAAKPTAGQNRPTSHKRTPPAAYKREPSQVPDGGWYSASATGRGAGNGGGHNGGRKPPDGSDSSPDDSSSDSENNTSSPESSESSESEGSRKNAKGKSTSEKRHRKKQKQEVRDLQALLKRIKLREPSRWTGHPDLDEFDQWCYELDTWAEVNDVPDGFVVKTMMNYLGGKAAKFFMNHVAPERNKWSKQDVYDGLFDYCFPEDFKRVLRAKLERAYQGTTSWCKSSGKALINTYEYT
ncbi:hypothetical protein BD310DRAFT_980233 [Dichomitus squalens]|uniref:Uncharacterized protein n=1 Tax=Dichomitus squalens TaxID=114155 RepID=A0A4V2K735_9APHY|nr:hypothetical protein BD310DRAFT_980233 [Dichomitus squalens]